MESSNLLDNIIDVLVRPLDKAGIYYRIFARKKTPGSIAKKLDSKYKEYLQKGKKMQDFIGVRIVFYFPEDVQLYHNLLSEMDGYDSKNESNTNKELTDLTELLSELVRKGDGFSVLKDKLPLDDKLFMPQRLNVVMKMKETIAESMQYELPIDLKAEYKQLIDTTYEVQLRTVLSEGWHEVEHDLRYKTIKDGWWNYCRVESRQLNSIYASLEASEKALSNLVDEIAYQNYKMHEWDAMIRNHLKLRFKENNLSATIKEYLNEDDRRGKRILNFDRQVLIKKLWSISFSYSLTTDFAFFLINRLQEEKTETDIVNMEPKPIKTILDKIFGIKET